MSKRTYTKVPITAWRKLLAIADSKGSGAVSKELDFHSSWLSGTFYRGATSSHPPGVRPNTLNKILTYTNGTTKPEITHSEPASNGTSVNGDSLIKALTLYAKLSKAEKKLFSQLLENFNPTA